MRIPFNNFKKKYADDKKKIDNIVQKVLVSGHYILGKEIRNFEEKFAEYIGVKHVIGVANGLEAIQIALMALEIKEGDEVITTSLSAAATALAIKSVGAKPVFVDIDEYFHIDPDKIEEKISRKTKAVLPVNLYGQAANIPKIKAVADKYKIAVIEDSAQSHGAELFGKKTGSFGKLGCFSFYPTKNLGAYGDGGAISTNDDFLAEKCSLIRNYGQKNRYEHEIYGLNSRLDELQAAILSFNLKKLDGYNKKRIEIANIYTKNLSGISKIKLPKIRTGSIHVNHLFVVEAYERNDLQSFLKKEGVETLIHYPILIHKQKCFEEFNNISLPVAEEKVKKIISLPIHPYLSKKEVLYVCEKIKDFYEDR